MNNNDNDGEEANADPYNDNDDDDYQGGLMPYAMDMDNDRVGLFQRTYKAFSSDQLPESNLREQLEFGGKSTILLLL